MRSPLIALTWEIWQRGHRFASATLGLLCLCAVLNATAWGRENAFKNFEPAYWLLMVFSIFLGFGIFHYAEFDRRKNWHGFPYRLFALPVRTWVLVACPMILGVVCVELTYAAWARFVFAPVGRNVSFWPAAVLGVGLMCYQAIVWALAGFRITRMIALALAGMVLMSVASLQLFLPFIAWPTKQVWRVSEFALIGAAIVSFAGGCHFVDRQRHGGGRGRGWLRSQIGRLIDAVPRRNREFVSPAQAQFWFEWRRAGMGLPASVIATLVMVFGPVSWLGRHDSEATLWTLGWAAALPLILGGVIGKTTGKPDGGATDLSFPPFLAIRPITSEDFVATKLKVAAVSVALTWAAVLVFLALWLPLWANLAQLRDLWDSGVALRGVVSLRAILVLSVVAAGILTWRFMVDSLWVGLSGNMKWLVIYSIFSTTALGVAVWCVVFWIRHFEWKYVEQYVSWLGWALVLAVVSKLWLAVFSWRNISPGRTLRYVLFWIGASGCLMALGMLVCPSLFWLKHLVMLAALLPVPLARLGFAPLSLTRNRHR